MFDVRYVNKLMFYSMSYAYLFYNMFKIASNRQMFIYDFLK